MDENRPPSLPQANPALNEQLSTTRADIQINEELKMRGLPVAIPTDEAMARDLNLSPGEELLCVVKRHAIGIAQFYISTVLGISILLAFLYLFITHKSSTSLNVIPDYVGVVVVLLLAILLWVINTVAIKIYRMNRLVLTSESLIVEQQQGLFNKDRKSLGLEAIEDVSYDQKGILQPMFNYGTIEVATIGKGNVSFVLASEPKKYADYINNAKEQLKRSAKYH